MNDIAVADSPRDLSLLTEGRRLLAEAKTIDEVREIRDQAAAIGCYLRKRDAGREMLNDAAEVMLWAERRGGELLGPSDKWRAGRRPGKSFQNGRISSDTNARSGLSYKDEWRWRAIAAIPPDEFEEHIANIKRTNDRLTMSGAIRLANRIRLETEAESAGPPRGTGIVGSLQQLIDRGELFATVYADPPWRYGNRGTRAAAGDHYVTMSVEEICAEPVAEVVQDNAHLHLWTTNAFLREAFDVMDAWGFTYKSCFVWVKPQMGIGNYWRVSHEFLLFGVRGKSPFRARDEISWGSFDRGEHSEKPDEIRQKIERVSPGPYLEMYGRESPLLSAWTVHGNQVQRTLS